MKIALKDLTLLVMFMSGWEEDSRNNPGEKVFRSWKGYLYKIILELEKDNLIKQFSNFKSVIITEAGQARARELQKAINA